MSPSTHGNPLLTGHWQLDRVASDLVGTKVSIAIATTEEQLRKHAGNSGYGNGGTYSGGYGGRGGGAGGNGGGGGPTDTGPVDNGDGTPPSLEDFDAFRPLGPDFQQLRHRLLAVLTPPVQLQLDTGSDFMRIRPDNAPPYDYHTDEDFSRIDEYGTAKLVAGWSGQVFVLSAHYSSHATLIVHYAVDAPANTLTVTANLRDPMVGKIDVRSVYHRQ